jgi:hypothetical protein
MEKVFFWDIEQQTEEWFKIKLGKISSTAANLFLVNGQHKSGLGSGALKLAKKIAAEIITGESESYGSVGRAAERGNLNEPEARAEYSKARFVKVHEVGFVQYNNLVGCSPDGIILNTWDELLEDYVKGLIEIKCFLGTHYLTMLDMLEERGEIIKEMTPQMQWQMMCTGFQFNDLVLYHPNFPRETRLKIHRMYADELTHSIFKIKLKAFIIEVNRLLKLAKFSGRVNYGDELDELEEVKEIDKIFDNFLTDL